MNSYPIESEKYAKCIAGSKRIRWDIDKDVIRDRTFDFTKKFLPDGLSRIDRLPFLEDLGKVRLSQIQGRTYSSMFGFVERFITAKILELAGDHVFGDQIALEALIRFADEELKHQELFRRLEVMIATEMPGGYKFPWDPNTVSRAILEKCTWAVMALIYEIELFTQEHYRQSMAREPDLSELYRDVFLFHWKEESHHAIMDALEWPRIDAGMNNEQRDKAVDEVIELIGSVDEILTEQSRLDANYFLQICEQKFDEAQREEIRNCLLDAYRWQYIFSGVEHSRFRALLGEITTPEQRERLEAALADLAHR
ncbi:hypothetical protein [Desulfomonile tiedjei]|uniref:Uncharacterized protein n=1 Tax=Desulfomonile tiedjei (strain ATCC 49306 / DSM 6799 / DCB-1) TaxID=706587 RepID=I4C699_DESTA|nr:hypothetical protein [Desulfomonile tiedjei]AFM25090.1 hypothetical protein Desti_2408 [Desulfomonile tiedjei DSM 6799]